MLAKIDNIMKIMLNPKTKPNAFINVLFFFSSSLVKIFSYGFNQETLDLASYFTKISLLWFFNFFPFSEVNS